MDSRQQPYLLCSKSSVHYIPASSCCKKQCLKDIPPSILRDLWATVIDKKVDQLPYLGWVPDCPRKARFYSGKSMQWKTNINSTLAINRGILLIADKVVCSRAFSIAHFMFKSAFYRHFPLRSLDTEASRRLVITGGPSAKIKLLLLWFDSLIRTEGDIHPESGIIYLPAGNTKALLSNNYLDHHNRVNTVSFTQFNHIWDTHY
ncbi:hypothetical protein BDK51DRAFT_28576 [Blyttiomyces helicus]|uniref:Uncharacterized protein n=1 Tax=Blyttiomyces helicus TaxID=388810 RepID=A0A4P9W1U1_9FUNG|nr:hypothetical protein BDK51DRAFT_28576 [Blyttiomyces helicus]|eukprot:RKO84550.1 hypothetical protein BDK51DRAFT_28576 [Blyttiomyces helicus]